MCWSPEKKAYGSHLEAIQASKSQDWKYKLEPYLCICGNWHLRTARTKKQPYRRPKYPVWKGYK